MTRRHNLLGCLAVLLITAVSPTVADNAGREEYRFAVPNFSDLSRKEADEASAELVEAYYRGSAALIRQLENKDASAEGKVYAIYLLGELRVAHAARLLVEHIDLKAPRVDPKTRARRWGEYPASEALTKIGKRAIPEIMAKLPNETKEQRRQLMVSVIRDVEGEKFGLLLLQDSIKRETDPEKKAKLESALKEFESLGPPDKSSSE